MAAAYLAEVSERPRAAELRFVIEPKRL